MLNALERRLAAIVAEGVAARQHLSVVAAGPLPELDGGEGAVLVTVTEVAPDAVFSPGDRVLTGAPGAAASRRILPLGFTACVELFVRPDGDTPAGFAAARALLLDDLATVAHRLADPAVRTGEAFAAAGPDPGFQVHELRLTTGTAGRELAEGVLAGELRYTGRAEIWPVGVTQPEGEILTVDSAVALLPAGGGA